MTVFVAAAPPKPAPSLPRRPDRAPISTDLSDTRSTDVDPADPAESFDDLHDHFDRRPPPRRSRRADLTGPRVVDQGRSGRILVDRSTPSTRTAMSRIRPATTRAMSTPTTTVPRSRSSPYSSYDVAAHGPDPVPDWVVTALSRPRHPARHDQVRQGGRRRLLERSLPGGPGCLLAVKTFRERRSPDVPPGRRLPGGSAGPASRETRAMANRTAFGRELMSGQWAAAEFAALSAMWKAGPGCPTRCRSSARN